MIQKISPRTSKERILQAFEEGYFDNNHDKINSINHNLLKDKEVALQVVSVNGMCYQNLIDELKNDKDIIKTAVNQCASVYDDIPEKFKNDKDIVISFVSSKSIHSRSGIDAYLNKLDEEWLSDKDVAMAACYNNAKALNFFDYKFRDNPEVVKILKDEQSLDDIIKNAQNRVDHTHKNKDDKELER